MASTLASRMQWILANRARDDGSAWDAKALSLASGLGPSHVGQIARGTTKNPQLETIQAIAAKARVSAAWLATGAGSPDSLDADQPAVTQSSEPVAENIPGYLEVEQLDRRAHPNEVEEEHWLSARKAAAYVIHGPAAPGDAIKLARLAKEFADPARVRKAFADQEERIKAMHAEMERERLEFQRQLAELKVGKKPSAKKTQTVAAAERELGKRATQGIDETSGKKGGRG